MFQQAKYATEQSDFTKRMKIFFVKNQGSASKAMCANQILKAAANSCAAATESSPRRKPWV
jgi:hypothetical protein